jgi:hypothetical protein
MQGYSKGNKGLFITVHYVSYVETSIQGYSKWSKGPFIYGSIIMANYRPLCKAIVRGVSGLHIGQLYWLIRGHYAKL